MARLLLLALLACAGASASAAEARSLSAPAAARQAGAERQTFWAFDFAAKQYYRTEAHLTHASSIVEFWVEDGLSTSDELIRTLAERFETAVQPRLRQAYGPRGTGGDAGGAITVMLLDIRDAAFYGSAGTVMSGYYDPANESRQADLDRAGSQAKSNERPMFYVDLPEPAQRDTLLLEQGMAHEYTHLIRWRNDPVEDTWLDEGFSELGVYLAGLGLPRAHVLDFLAAPETPLTAWEGTSRDYGKVFLFLLYLNEQFGAADPLWLQKLMRDPEDGLASIAKHLPPDRPLASVFRDWATALYLGDPTAADGRYGFRSLDLDNDGTRPELPHMAVHDWNDAATRPISGTVAAWSIHAERLWQSEPAELTLDTRAGICAMGVWPAPEIEGLPRRHWEPRCLPAGASASWVARVPSDGRRWPVHVVLSNAAEQPAHFTLSAAEDSATQHMAHVIYLPLLRRR